MEETVIELHEYLNPNNVLYQDMNDVSTVSPHFSGSALTLHSGTIIYVSESPSVIWEKIGSVS